MRMQLTGHMAYDSTPADEESAIHDEDSNAPVTFSVQPAQIDQLEGDRRDSDDQQSKASSLRD